MLYLIISFLLVAVSATLLVVYRRYLDECSRAIKIKFLEAYLDIFISYFTKKVYYKNISYQLDGRKSLNFVIEIIFENYDERRKKTNVYYQAIRGGLHSKTSSELLMNGIYSILHSKFVKGAPNIYDTVDKSVSDTEMYFLAEKVFDIDIDFRNDFKDDDLFYESFKVLRCHLPLFDIEKDEKKEDEDVSLYLFESNMQKTMRSINNSIQDIEDLDFVIVVSEINDIYEECVDYVENSKDWQKYIGLLEEFSNFDKILKEYCDLNSDMQAKNEIETENKLKVIIENCNNLIS